MRARGLEPLTSRRGAEAFQGLLPRAVVDRRFLRDWRKHKKAMPWRHGLFAFALSNVIGRKGFVAILRFTDKLGAGMVVRNHSLLEGCFSIASSSS